MRDVILAKLREVDEMLAEATCCGDQLATIDQVYRDVMTKLSALELVVEHYVD